MRLKDLVPKGKSLSHWALDHGIYPNNIYSIMRRNNKPATIKAYAAKLGVSQYKLGRALKIEYFIALIFKHKLTRDEWAELKDYANG